MKANTIGMEERVPEVAEGRDTGDNPTEDLREQFACLRERVRVLEDERRELQAFSALAAHELLEPIVMADAYAQLIIDRIGESDADSLDHLLALSRSLARGRVLVEALLQETAAPRRLLETVSVDLNSVMRDTLELLRPEISSRKAKVNVQAMPSVQGHAALLSSLMKNLLINALKYGPRAGGHIDITSERVGDDLWQVNVASEGPPISEADRRAIFQPFRRGYGERRARGAGLGLAICQRIVERHGGRIQVNPGPGGFGNIFSFTVPA